MEWNKCLGKDVTGMRSNHETDGNSEEVGRSTSLLREAVYMTTIAWTLYKPGLYGRVASRMKSLQEFSKRHGGK